MVRIMNLQRTRLDSISRTKTQQSNADGMLRPEATQRRPVAEPAMYVLRSCLPSHALRDSSHDDTLHHKCDTDWPVERSLVLPWHSAPDKARSTPLNASAEGRKL